MAPAGCIFGYDVLIFVGKALFLRQRQTEEIIEELGDVTWYCFSLAQIHNKDRSVNVFIKDIALLKKEIGTDNDRAEKSR